MQFYNQHQIFNLCIVLPDWPTFFQLRHLRKKCQALLIHPSVHKRHLCKKCQALIIHPSLHEKSSKNARRVTHVFYESGVCFASHPLYHCLPET